MPHDAKAEALKGTLQNLLFSPKGSVEGLLVQMESKLVQVSMEPTTASASTLADAVGKPIEVIAKADHSPKTKDKAHPVYKLEAIRSMGGETFKSHDDAAPISGIVARIHFARHGEPNGVVLETGEFIHTRPPAMKKLKLEVGSRVVARGELRTTVLGTPMVEADEVNRVHIE